MYLCFKAGDWALEPSGATLTSIHCNSSHIHKEPAVISSTEATVSTRSSAQGNCSAKSLAGNVVDSSLSPLSSTSHANTNPQIHRGGGQGGGRGRGHFHPPAIYCTTTWCFALKGLRTTTPPDGPHQMSTTIDRNQGFSPKDSTAEAACQTLQLSHLILVHFPLTDEATRDSQG